MGEWGRVPIIFSLPHTDINDHLKALRTHLRDPRAVGKFPTSNPQKLPLRNNPPMCAHRPTNVFIKFFLSVLFQRGIACQSSPLSSQHTPAASVRKSGREIDDFRPTLFRHTSLDCLLSYIYYIYINIFFFFCK